MCEKKYKMDYPYPRALLWRSTTSVIHHACYVLYFKCCLHMCDKTKERGGRGCYEECQQSSWNSLSPLGGQGLTAGPISAGGEWSWGGGGAGVVLLEVHGAWQQQRRESELSEDKDESRINRTNSRIIHEEDKHQESNVIILFCIFKKIFTRCDFSSSTPSSLHITCYSVP